MAAKRLVTGVTAIYLSLIESSFCLQANDRVRDIIDNVRANEALYDNIDVCMLDKYELIGGKPRVNKSNGMVMVQKGTVTKEVRYVSQNGMFRVDVAGDSTTADGTLSEDRIRMFDGEVTRVFDQKIIGNIIAGRKNDSNVVRPHMLLMRTSLETIRLSTYLQGHVALVADPDINWDPAHTIDVSYQGDDEFLDLKCHKLWVTTSVPREKGRTLPYVRFELWLAERRNYIPVRSLVFAFRFSKTLPYKESSVSEFREIEPGIWFPFAATHLGYNDFPLREGRQEPHGRYTYEVRSVSLNPTYEKSFFRDLTFPPNTSVYEVEDGKIVKSYLTGEGTKSAWGWWILLINIAVIVAFLAVLVLRRHRKRRGAVA